MSTKTRSVKGSSTLVVKETGQRVCSDLRQIFLVSPRRGGRQRHGRFVNHVNTRLSRDVTDITKKTIGTHASMTTYSPPTRLIIQRKRLDALLVGTLVDILSTSHFQWQLLDINASSPLSVQILETIFVAKRTINQKALEIQTLIIQEASSDVLAFLGSNCFHSMQLMEKHATWIRRFALRKATLSYSSWKIFTEGLLQLGSTRSYNSCICHLEFTDLSFPSTDAVKLLALALEHQYCLETISFRACHLEDVEVALLLHALKTNHPYLIEVGLSLNYCKSEGTSSLLQLLTLPTNNLQRVDVSFQDTWDNQQHFARFGGNEALLHPHCTLCVLNLSSNFVNDDSLMFLVKGLTGTAAATREKPCLESLNLRDNCITDRGMMVLVDSLGEIQLKRLDISKNRYSMHVILPIEDQMKHQTSLTCLRVDHVNESHGGILPLLPYYLALNKAGRYCKYAKNVPLGLWPHILERASMYSSDSSGHSTSAFKDQKVEDVDDADADLDPTMKISHLDLIFDLLKGPAIFSLCTVL